MANPTDPTPAIALDAVSLKRHFKTKYGIPVRVSSSKHYITIRIQDSEKDHRKPSRYDHAFPLELRVSCLNTIYPTHIGSEMNLSGAAGNVRSHSIAMHPREWSEVLSKP